MSEGQTSFWQRTRSGWLEIAGAFGEVQTLILLVVTYLVAIGPIALFMTAARQDLLHKRLMRVAGSAWNPADSTTSPDLERAKRLF